ncbi:MAG: phosphotransferase family protein [Bacilli bacterium]
MSEILKPRVSCLVQRLKDIYPDFSVTSVRWLDSGQNNDVLEINNSWIFRFARHLLGAANLGTEVVVLQYLKGKLPLKVPTPEYVYHGFPDSKLPFMGYRKISGIPLTREWVISTEVSNLNILAAALADFLRILHTLPIPQEIINIVPFQNKTDYWSNIFERIQRLLFPYMRFEARNQVKEHFESFLNSSRDADDGMSLIHGDFGGRNILLSDNYRGLEGVIDFGSVGLGDPAIDYAAISTVHPQMLELIEKSNPHIRRYMDRIKFYTGTFALQEALYGAESGDENALRSGLKQYI